MEKQSKEGKMRPASIDDMEAGNMIFGHSRGEFLVPREWTDDFYELFLACHTDDYGYADEGDKHARELVSKENGIIENARLYDSELFSIMPYFWGDSEELSKIPNFVYKPTGFEMRWYKYPLRDSYANILVTHFEFVDMIQNCIASVEKENRTDESSDH
jgi:hypothetical protein